MEAIFLKKNLTAGQPGAPSALSILVFLVFRYKKRRRTLRLPKVVCVVVKNSVVAKSNYLITTTFRAGRPATRTRYTPAGTGTQASLPAATAATRRPMTS